MKPLFVLTTLLLLLCSLSVHAKTLYKWVDTQGRITYQDQPPPRQFHTLQTIETESRTIYRRVDDQGVVTFEDQFNTGAQAQVLPGASTHETPSASLPLRPITQRPTHAEARPAHDPFIKVPNTALYALTSLAILAALLALLKGFYVAKIKGWIGERRVALVLHGLGYPALHDIIVDCEDGHPTQIDHIARTPSGIVVIETKNYKGSIYGKAHDKTWTVCLARHRYKMQNPLHQNHRHVKAIQALVPDVPVIGHVVFAGSARPPESVAGNVSSLGDFIHWAKKLENGTLSEALLESAWAVLAGHARTDRASRTAQLASLRARFE